MSKLIVSLLSDQTIQNVMFIKQMKNERTEHLFASTQKMEEKGIKKWIINVCGIKEIQTKTITIKEDSIKNIKEELSKIDFSTYEEILVNVTGGTKMMSIGVKEFFNDKRQAKMYYMPINKNEIVDLQNEKTEPINCEISLSDYLKSYGVKVENESKPLFPEEYTKEFYKEHYEKLNSKGILGSLRKDRKKNRENSWQELKGIGFKEDLNKKEIAYLTGGWFEEFVYFKIKKELNLADDYIKNGVQITSGQKNVQNEFDVLYLKDYKLYSIECKTSILDGNNENKSIMSETIYKAKALQKDFGLTAKASIYTLSSKQEIKNSGMERASYFDIDIKSREDFNA
ncbi:hypothetical protein R83H12_01076 [Fibrobacteria bacterium R8-3-H12]